jgi:uncharacterized RDD family membrane protein YckC
MAQISTDDSELVGCMNLERFFASMIDNVIALVFVLFAAFRLGYLGPVISWSAVGLAYFGYYLLSEVLFGNTFGKWSMGLCIRTLDGKKCSRGQALTRSLLRLVEVNPIFLGGLPAGLAIYFSKRRQRIGDRLAGTVVIRR